MTIASGNFRPETERETFVPYILDNLKVVQRLKGGFFSLAGMINREAALVTEKISNRPTVRILTAPFVHLSKYLPFFNKKAGSSTKVETHKGTNLTPFLNDPDLPKIKTIENDQAKRLAAKNNSLLKKGDNRQATPISSEAWSALVDGHDKSGCLNGLIDYIKALPLTETIRPLLAMFEAGVARENKLNGIVDDGKIESSRVKAKDNLKNLAKQLSKEVSDLREGASLYQSFQLGMETTIHEKVVNVCVDQLNHKLKGAEGEFLKLLKNCGNIAELGTQKKDDLKAFGRKWFPESWCEAFESTLFEDFHEIFMSPVEGTKIEEAAAKFWKRLEEHGLTKSVEQTLSKTITDQIQNTGNFISQATAGVTSAIPVDAKSILGEFGYHFKRPQGWLEITKQSNGLFTVTLYGKFSELDLPGPIPLVYEDVQGEILNEELFTHLFLYQALPTWKTVEEFNLSHFSQTFLSKLGDPLSLPAEREAKIKEVLLNSKDSGIGLILALISSKASENPAHFLFQLKVQALKDSWELEKKSSESSFKALMKDLKKRADDLYKQHLIDKTELDRIYATAEEIHFHFEETKANAVPKDLNKIVKNLSFLGFGAHTILSTIREALIELFGLEMIKPIDALLQELSLELPDPQAVPTINRRDSVLPLLQKGWKSALGQKEIGRLVQHVKKFRLSALHTLRLMLDMGTILYHPVIGNILAFFTHLALVAFVPGYTLLNSGMHLLLIRMVAQYGFDILYTLLPESLVQYLYAASIVVHDAKKFLVERVLFIATKTLIRLSIDPKTIAMINAKASFLQQSIIRSGELSFTLPGYEIHKKSVTIPKVQPAVSSQNVDQKQLQKHTEWDASIDPSTLHETLKKWLEESATIGKKQKSKQAYFLNEQIRRLPIPKTKKDDQFWNHVKHPQEVLESLNQLSLQLANNKEGDLYFDTEKSVSFYSLYAIIDNLARTIPENHLEGYQANACDLMLHTSSMLTSVYSPKIYQALKQVADYFEFDLNRRYTIEEVNERRKECLFSEDSGTSLFTYPVATTELIGFGNHSRERVTLHNPKIIGRSYHKESKYYEDLLEDPAIQERLETDLKLDATFFEKYVHLYKDPLGDTVGVADHEKAMEILSYNVREYSSHDRLASLGYLPILEILHQAKRDVTGEKIQKGVLPRGFSILRMIDTLSRKSIGNNNFGGTPENISRIEYCEWKPAVEPGSFINTYIVDPVKEKLQPVLDTLKPLTDAIRFQLEVKLDPVSGCPKKTLPINTKEELKSSRIAQMRFARIGVKGYSKDPINFDFIHTRASSTEMGTILSKRNPGSEKKSDPLSDTLTIQERINLELSTVDKSDMVVRAIAYFKNAHEKLLDPDFRWLLDILLFNVGALQKQIDEYPQIINEIGKFFKEILSNPKIKGHFEAYFELLRTAIITQTLCVNNNKCFPDLRALIRLEADKRVKKPEKFALIALLACSYVDVDIKALPLAEKRNALLDLSRQILRSRQYTSHIHADCVASRYESEITQLIREDDDFRSEVIEAMLKDGGLQSQSDQKRIWLGEFPIYSCGNDKVDLSCFTNSSAGRYSPNALELGELTHGMITSVEGSTESGGIFSLNSKPIIVSDNGKRILWKRGDKTFKLISRDVLQLDLGEGAYWIEEGAKNSAVLLVTKADQIINETRFNIVSDNAEGTTYQIDLKEVQVGNTRLHEIDLNQTTHGLTLLAWFNPLTKIKAFCNPNDKEKICRLEFTSAGLNFQLKTDAKGNKQMMSEGQFPGYFISKKQKIDSLKHIPKFLLIENGEGEKKCLIPRASEMGLMTQFLANEVVKKNTPDFLFKLLEEHLSKDQKEEIFTYSLDKDGQLTSSEPAAIANMLMVCISQNDLKGAKIWLDRLQKAGRLSPFNESVLQQINLCLLPLLLFNKNEWPSVGMKLAAIRETNILMPNAKSNGTFRLKLFKGVLDGKQSDLLYCILLQNGYDSYLEDLKNGVLPLLDDTDELFILNYIGRTTLSFVKDNIIDKTQPQSMAEKAADYLLPQNMIEQFLKFPAIVHRAHAIKSRLGEEISYIDALSYFMYLGYIDRSAIPAANGNGPQQESRILETAMNGLRVVDAKFSALATRVEKILGPDFMSLVDKMAMMKVAKVGLKRFKKNSDSDFNLQYIESKLFVPIPEAVRAHYGPFIEKMGVHLDTLFLTNPSSLQKAFPLYFRLAINSPPDGLNEQQTEIFKEKSAAFRNTLKNLDGKFKLDDQKLISFLQLMMQYNKPLTEELSVLEEYWNGTENNQQNRDLLNEKESTISREIDSLKSGIENLKRWEKRNKNYYTKDIERKAEKKNESWLDRLKLNENFENVPILINSDNLERHFIAYYAFALGKPPLGLSGEETERFMEKSRKLREELKTADQGLLFVRFLKAAFKSPHKDSLPSPDKIQQIFSDLKNISAIKKGDGTIPDSNLEFMQKNIADYHSEVTGFGVLDKSNCEDIYQILDASIKDLFVNKTDSDHQADPAKIISYKADIEEKKAKLEVLELELKTVKESIDKIKWKNHVLSSLLNIAKSQKPSFVAPIIKKIPQTTVKYLKQGVNQLRKLPPTQAGIELAKKALRITQFGLYFFSPIAFIPWLKWGVTMAKRVFWTARVGLETGHSVSQLAQSFKKVKKNSPQGHVSENIKEMLAKREALIGKHYQDLLMKYFDAEIKEDQNRIEEPIPSYQPLTSESAVKDAFKKLNQSIDDYYARVPDKKVSYRLKKGIDPLEVLNELKGLKQEFESYQEKLKLDVETFVASILNKGKRAFEIQEHPSFHEIENYFIKGEEAVLFRNTLDQPEHLTLLQEKLYLYQLIRSRTTLLFETLDKIDSGTTSDFNGLGIELARERVYSFSDDRDEQWLKAKLAFESRTGKLLWKKPMEQLKQMLFSDKKKLVIELLPGSGKTYWGIPTTDFMLADGENLPINIWPASLAKTNTEGIADQAQDLFNQQSLAVHFSRHTGWDLNRVAAFFNVLKRAILNKEQFNMTKEDAQTLELKSLEISLKLIEGKGKPDDKQVFDLMRKGLVLFRKVGKAVPDETHEVFNCRKELNFPFGGAKTLKSSYATVINQVMFHLANDPEVLKHVPLKEEKWSEVSKEKFAQNVRPILAKHMAEAPWLAISPQNREEFSLYISGQTDKIPAFVEKSKYKKEIGLIKGLLVHLLPHTLESIIDVNFTHSNDSSEEFAKPSESNKDPQDNSLIQNPFEAYVKTCILNLKNGISEEKMGSLLKALESEAKEESKKSSKIHEKTKAGKLFALITKEHSLGSIDETNRLQIIRMMVKNDHAVLEYVKRYIKPQIRYYGFRLSSNPQNFASMFSSFYSDTGTPFNDGTYPKGTEVIWDKGTLGESIHILREKCNHEHGVQILQCETPKDVLSELLNDNFLDSKSPYRAIIDRGALFRGLSHEFVANSILEFANVHRPDIQGVVFYTSDKKRVVLEKGALKPTPYSDCRIPKENLITYYDQGHTFGSDIPQADWANAVVTVGEDIQLYNLAQSKWRMRLLKKGNQSIKIVMTRKVYEAMNLAGKKPTIDDVIVFAQTNEASDLAELNYQADKQILHDIVRRQILDEAFEQKSTKKALAVIAEFKDFLCTPLEDDPFKLYGGIDRYVDPLVALEEYKKYLKGIVENSHSLNSSRIKFIQQEFDEMPAGSYPSLVHTSDPQSENALGMQVEVVAENSNEETDEQEQTEDIVNEAVQEIDMNQHQSISIPEEYAREINLWPWPEDLDLTNSEWLEIKAAEYALIPRGKFPLFKIKEVVKNGYYHSLQEIAPHFSPEILSTNNFTPLINTNWIPTSIQPFSPFQKGLTEALVVVNGNERKIIMLDGTDASYWRKRLERERNEKTLKDRNVQIFLYDIELGCAVSSAKGSVNEESLSSDTIFQRAIVQLKFLNGSVHYNDNQKIVLERWIRKGGVDKMQKAFLDIHKDHKTSEYPGSSIDTLFHQLSH